MELLKRSNTAPHRRARPPSRKRITELLHKYSSSAEELREEAQKKDKSQEGEDAPPAAAAASQEGQERAAESPQQAGFRPALVRTASKIKKVYSFVSAR